MRGMTDDMSIGERAAFYRKWRGLSQEILAGLIGRTADWLRKVEHNRIPLDRLSVIRRLASALDVSLGDLIGEPALMEWNEATGNRTVPALRVALMNHRQFLLRAADPPDEPVRLDLLEREIAIEWEHYQQSRYSWLSRRLPLLITDAQTAAQQYNTGSKDGLHAHRLLASVHQLATAFLTKLGEADLASISATKGLTAAHASGNELIIGSLYRSVAHALLSIGEYEQAVALTRAVADHLQTGLGRASPEYLSVYGMLHLVGGVAASRHDNRGDTTAFLAEAEESARRLGGDGNYLWTAFGPTNVAIHRVTPPPWNSATCRSQSILAPASTPPACRSSGGCVTRSKQPARSPAGIGATLRSTRCSPPNNKRRNKFATTVCPASSSATCCAVLVHLHGQPNSLSGWVCTKPILRTDPEAYPTHRL